MNSPNVLLIVVDALRADRVGNACEKDLTPHIDGFADDATTFSNAFTTTNATDPAVTSIHTGRYPLSNGIVNHGSRVTDQEKQRIEQVSHLPAVLSNNGYRTCKFGRPLGRWHRQGFDSYPSSMEGTNAKDYTPTKVEKVSRSLSSVEDSIGSAIDRIHPDARDVVSKYYHGAKRAAQSPFVTISNDTDESDDAPDELVEKFKNFVNNSVPFYAYVHLMNTHNPYDADHELVKSFLDEYEYPVERVAGLQNKVPKAFEESISDGKFPEIREKYYFPDGKPSSAVVNAHYDASVREADQRVGKLLQTLKDTDIYDETLIFFLSDHGESLTEHGIYYDHHGLYDVTTHVPMIVRTPDSVPKRVDDFVQITDIAPTVLSYTDTEGLDADGQSLRPALTGNSLDNREYVLAEEAHTQRRRMIRSGDVKLIYLLEGDTICRYCGLQHAPEVELYDLQADPEELKNKATSWTEDVDRLLKEAQTTASQYENRCPAIIGEKDVSYEDEREVEERLQALGYR